MNQVFKIHNVYSIAQFELNLLASAALKLETKPLLHLTIESFKTAA